MSSNGTARKAIHYIDVRRREHRWASSLGAHLALGFGVFAIVLSGLISYAAGHLAAAHTGELIGVSLSRLAEELRDKLDYGMYERVRQIQSLAAIDARVRTPDLSAARRVRGEQLQKIEPHFSWIAYANPAGVVTVATGDIRDGAQVAAADWFKRGQYGQAVSDVMGSGTVDTRYIELGVPLKDVAGNAVGVLGARLNWSWAQQLRETLLDQPAGRGRLEVFIFSRDGVLLLGSDGNAPALPPRLLRAAPSESVWSLDEWPDGNRYLAGVSVTRGYADYAAPVWYVMVRQEAEDALEPVRAMQLQIAGVGALFALLFAGLAWWSARRVARPLKQIAAAAARGGEIPVIEDYIEVAQLTDALRGMIAGLRRSEEEVRQARDKLELRVRERFAEATRARAELQTQVIEREHAQRERQQTMELFELALRAAGMAVWSYDVSSGEVNITDEWARMIGGPPGPVRTTLDELRERVPADERDMVRMALYNMLMGTQMDYRINHHVTRADGTLLLTESRGRVVERDSAGRAVRMIGTIAAVAGKPATD